jgi:hypothetical protein
MALTNQQRKTLILAEIGDDGTAEDLWSSILDKAQSAAKRLAPITAEYYADLVDLECKLLAIDVLLGSVRASYDVAADQTRLTRSQLVTNLLKLRTETVTLRDTFVTARKRGAAPKVGVLTTKAPVVSPTWYSDANDILYQGDPNQQPIRVQP